jgi:RHS repeat-associated protein
MSVSGSIGGATESAAYTYDNVGRLVTSNQTSNGVSAQRRFVYDRWGNRTEVWNATSGGSQIQSVSLEQSGGVPTNRITSVTAGSTLNYTYDAAGNVTSDGVHSYTYDAENRVVSVNGGSTASYSYDHQNRRVKKTVGSTTTHYVWEGSSVIAEHNGSTGAVITEYIFAGSRMIARESGGRVFFLYDRLSVRATITDGQGNIQGRQSHLPFGEELVGTGTTDKHRFTSYERDSETGTDYAVNRQYAQGIGRFTRPDPYEGSYDYEIPQSLNRYAYVENDPANATDPTGLFIYVDPCYDPILGIFRCSPNGGLPLRPPIKKDEGDSGSPPAPPKITLKRVEILSGDYVEHFSFGSNTVSFVFSNSSSICDDTASFGTLLDLYFTVSDPNAEWNVLGIDLEGELIRNGDTEKAELGSLLKRVRIRLIWRNRDEADERRSRVRIRLEAKKSNMFGTARETVTAIINMKCRD